MTNEVIVIYSKNYDNFKFTYHAYNFYLSCLLFFTYSNTINILFITIGHAKSYYLRFLNEFHFTNNLALFYKLLHMSQ